MASFQEEHEIPASVFVKEPASGTVEGKGELEGESQSLEDALHTVDLSSEDELPHNEAAQDDSGEDKTEESRAEKLKRSSLRKVDSLKKAFSRQNIEKKMTKLGTKIVSVERREKIKKSLTPNAQKTASGGKSSPFKVSPLSFGRKKVREGESPVENETKSEETASNDPEEGSLAEGVSAASLPSALAEGEAEKLAPRRSSSGMDSNVDLTIVEDEEEEPAALEQAQNTHYEDSHLSAAERAAALQVDQSA